MQENIETEKASDKEFSMLNNDFYATKRKIIINWANKDLIKICENRLQNYLFTDNWKLFNSGFISLNNKIDLEDFVKFPICPSNARNKNFLD